MTDQASSASDQAAFFLSVAAIGATLFGLTLVALASFLPELMKRFEGAALAAFPERDRHQHVLPALRPYSLSDRELLDGDPLVFFIAYSIGVSWNLFCLPVAIGLTAAWPEVPICVCGIEMAVFWGFMYISFKGRQTSIKKMQVYLTREERYWPLFTWIIMLSLAGATLLIGVASFAPFLKSAAYFALWLRHGISNEVFIVRTLRAVCILSLLVGTYSLNKEVFIYFKALTTEKVRATWIARFIEEHGALSHDVNEALSSWGTDDESRTQFLDEWDDGTPALASTHDMLRNQRYAADLKSLWGDLLKGKRGAPGWMLDVPKIASWEAKIRSSLPRRAAKMEQPED